MTATRAVRIAWQATWLALFVWLVARLAAGDPRAFPYSIFHWADPLSAAAVAAGQRTIPRPLAWASLLLLATILLGRFFCGWICPLGTLQQLVGRGFWRRPRPQRAAANRWRSWYALKQYALAGLLAAALVGSVQTGLLDPLSVTARALAGGIWPALPHGRAVPGGWLAVALLAAILLASRFIPRLFCRALCPLGALLGAFGRVSLWRIHRAEERCAGCGRCQAACQGAAEPAGTHRPAECMACLNCVESCPERALSFRLLGRAGPAPDAPDLSRRHLLGSVLTGLVAAPVLRASGGGGEAAPSSLIRPPGALAEPDFLARCVKCSLCQHACPTSAIQPALAQAGVEGFWTPVIVPRRGACELACTRCGEACPTGALIRLEPQRKTGYDGAPPVRIGTAFVDRGRCLPWAMATPCIVCEEMCPVDPKAIWVERVDEVGRGGQRVALQRPRVDPGRCVGCGLCENRCPVGEEAAIRVSSVGESRDPLNRMLLGR